MRQARSSVLPDTDHDGDRQRRQARRVRRKGARGLIRRHPLVSFFVMAFTLSWGAETPYVLSESGLGIAHFNFPVILGTTQITGALPAAYLGPILSAFLVTAAADGRPGLRVWAGRFFRWLVSWRWYAGVLIGVPAALAVTCSALSGGRVHAPTTALLAGYLPLLLVQVLTSGLAEEPGWRDFALPRLQRRYGPLRGTLILGPLWGAWHLPLFLTQSWGGWPHVPWIEPIEFTAGSCALSIVMTWIFNRSGESLPVAMIAHASINTFSGLAQPQMFPSLSSLQDMTGVSVLLPAAVIAALVVLAATRGRLGYRPHHQAQPS